MKYVEIVNTPHLGIMHQGFEMDQNQPSPQFLHSSFGLKISPAQTHGVGPKNMEIYGDYIPELKQNIENIILEKQTKEL